MACCHLGLPVQPQATGRWAIYLKTLLQAARSPRPQGDLTKMLSFTVMFNKHRKQGTGRELSGGDGGACPQWFGPGFSVSGLRQKPEES